MSYETTRSLNAQDCGIYMTLLGFLSTPLVLLVGAAMFVTF